MPCTGAAAFDTPGVGTGKPVSVSELTLIGAAADFVLASTTATTTAAITALTVTPSVAAASKPYDGTAFATLAQLYGERTGDDRPRCRGTRSTKALEL